jgi:sugar lactone lactonase YvrE
MSKRWLMYIAVAALVMATVAPAASAKPTGPDPAGARVTYQTKVFVRGAPLHGANGLAIDQRGRLIVASGLGCEIVKLDPRTGQILERIGNEVGVSPDDVAVGPDGESIYWTDFPTGQVGWLKPDGSFDKQFVAPGMNPIAFDENGRLFVGQAFAGDGLYELDPETLAVLRTVIPPTVFPPFAGQLNGFDFGPDGMLYAPQPFLQKIVKIDPYSDPATIEVVADLSAIGHPSSVKFDSRGGLYAEIANTGAIVRVDTVTGAYQVVAQVPSENLDNMVFDARDRLYVSEADGRVFAVAPGGGVRTLSPGGLMLPGGIALMEDDSGRESLFVTDVWKLTQFDARSGRVLGEERYSHLGGTIVQPWSVAPDGGHLIVASWMAGAVQIWDPVADTAVAVFPFIPPPMPDFAMPLNAIRFQDKLAVAQVGSGFPPGSVVALDDETGTKETVASGLIVPSGLVATEDDLWVADWAAGVVWKIVSDGATVTPEFVAGGLSFPEGMALDRDGSLLVVEAGAGRLSRIDPETGNVTLVVDGLELGMMIPEGVGPPTWALSSVAVSQDGTLFVTGDLADVVYRLKPLPAHRK